MQNPPDFVLFFSCIFLHFFSCVSVCSHVQYIVWDLAVPPNRHLYHPSLYNTPERFWIGEEPMTEITGFRQSVRLFQSYDPVTPSILSSFLLHLSDALPSGRVLLRLSVRVLTLTVLLRCRLFKWTFTTASTLPRGTVASLSGYFRFRSDCLYVTGFTRCLVNSYF